MECEPETLRVTKETDACVYIDFGCGGAPVSVSYMSNFSLHKKADKTVNILERHHIENQHKHKHWTPLESEVHSVNYLCEKQLFSQEWQTRHGNAMQYEM